MLRSLNLFAEGRDDSGKPRFHLKLLAPELKAQVIQHLALGRVAQHVPASRSGSKAELMTWGVTHIGGQGPDARISLHQSTCTVENGIRKKTTKTREERSGKLLGPSPKGESGKLKSIKGALIIGENFGLALDPKPQVIPFHQVTQHLEEIKKSNGGKMPRILRNGMLIYISDWKGKEGLWRICVCQASMKLDLCRPHEISRTWREVSLKSLLERGMSIIQANLSGG